MEARIDYKPRTFGLGLHGWVKTGGDGRVWLHIHVFLICFILYIDQELTGPAVYTPTCCGA